MSNKNITIRKSLELTLEQEVWKDNNFGPSYDYRVVNKKGEKFETVLSPTNIIMINVEYRGQGNLSSSNNKFNYETNKMKVYPLFFCLHESDIIIASSKKQIRKYFKKQIVCCKVKR